MATTQTLNRVLTELQILSEALGDPVPAWNLVPGGTSAFVHQSATIQLAQDVVDEAERTGNEMDLVALVAHEFYHWHQFNTDLNQDRPHVREINSRRFAKQWIQRRFPGTDITLPIHSPDQVHQPGIDLKDSELEVELQGERFVGASPEDQLFLAESFKPRGRPISTPLWLRFKIQRHGPANPWTIWREYRAFLKRFGYKFPSYEAIRSLMWLLTHELGFLTIIRSEESEFGSDKNIYDVVPEFAGDSRWNDPTGVLYGR